MAQVLDIRNLCDMCLTRDDGTETPAITYRIDVTVGAGSPRPFVVELCSEHGAPLANAVTELESLGRAPDKAPRTPRADRTRGDSAICPTCGWVTPTLSAMRGHLRKKHDTSLADAGLVPAHETCETCGSTFPNRQGLAAHARINHPKRSKQTA